MTRYINIPGALYNIIRVPPEKTDATDTLQGAKVLCSIVPKDKSHPSYYHSFGESASIPDWCIIKHTASYRAQ